MTYTKFVHRIALGLVLLTSLLISANAQDIPKNSGYVNDFAGVLSSNEKDALTQRVNQLKQNRDIEFGILIVNSTGNYPIAEYAVAAARQWGIGSKQGEHRGLLFVLATNDRKNFLTASRQLEGDFPDAKCAELCRAGRQPFGKSQWGAGTMAVVLASEGHANLAVAKQQRDTPLAAGSTGATTEQEDSGAGTVLLILLVLGGIAVLAGGIFFFFRRRGSMIVDPDVDDSLTRKKDSVYTAPLPWTSDYTQKQAEKEPEKPTASFGSVGGTRLTPPPRREERRREDRSKPSRSTSYVPVPVPIPTPDPIPSRSDDSSSSSWGSSWGSSSSSSSDSSSSSSWSSDSSSSSSSDFGGGGDFSGGGGGDSF